MYKKDVYFLKASEGYTLIEVLVSIGIMSIMMAIVGISFSSGKNYDTMKLENQRLASAIRNVRNRDFNGVVSYNNSTGTFQYPPLGYGLHIETKVQVCSVDTSKACYLPGDCTAAQGTCGAPAVNNERSAYTIFADYANADGGFYFDGGKTGIEYVEEFKAPKNFKFVLPSAATQAEIVFKGGASTVYAYIGAAWTTVTGATTYDIQLLPTGSLSCASTRSQKGTVSLNLQANNISDQVGTPCP